MSQRVINTTKVKQTTTKAVHVESEPLKPNATKLIDSCHAQARREAEQFAEQQRNASGLIHEKEKALQQVEAKSGKKASKLEKKLEKERKQQAAALQELDKQEAKTMEIAKDVANKQQSAQEAEDAKRRVLSQKEIQAAQLAEEITATLSQQRAKAEQYAAELLAREEEAKRRAYELANQHSIHVHTFEEQKRELVAEEVRIRSAEEDLEKRKRADQEEINRLQSELKAEEGDAKKVEEKLEQHASERAKLERQAWEIAHQEEIERDQSAQLRQKIGETEQVLAQLRADLEDTTARLCNTAEQTSVKVEQNQVVFTETQDTLRHEQEALDKASALAAETAKEREKAQRAAAKLAAEEQEARNRLAKLNEKALVGAEIRATQDKEPAVVDVYQHTRHTINDPQPEEINQVTHIEEGRNAPGPAEEKGVIGKVVDSVKSIF